MSAKHITPVIKAKMIALRQAGFSIASIADQTGTSISTVKRHACSTPKGGVKKELIDQAKKDLVSAISDDNIKQQIASLVADDLAIAGRIRASIASTVEFIESKPPEDLSQAFQTMRALSSASTGLKLSGDCLRSTFARRELPQTEEDLPELTIRDFTGAELEDIRKRSEMLSTSASDGLGGSLSEDNEIVTEGF